MRRVINTKNDQNPKNVQNLKKIQKNRIII